MILAVAVPEARELVIYGADTLAEQNQFLGHIESTSPELIQDTDFSRFFAERDLAGFKHPPTILEFESNAALDEFVGENSISLTTFANAHGKQKEMLARHEFNKDDGRTIGEITGYNSFDPFDRRTPEEKAKDEEKRLAAKTGKKKDDKVGKGEMTDDSFGHKSEGYRPDADENGIMIPPSEKKQMSQLQIDQVEFETNADGSWKLGPDGYPIIKSATVKKNFMTADYWHMTLMDDGVIDNRLASYVALTDKAGMGETNYDIGWDFFAHEEGGIVIRLAGASIVRLNEAMQDMGISKVMSSLGTGRECVMVPMLSELPDFDPNDPYRISLDEMVSIYFRVDVTGLDADTAREMILRHTTVEPFKSNTIDGNSWHAYVRRSDAEASVTALVGQGIEAELVEVDKDGVRLIEAGAGVKVLDKVEENKEPALPWNDGAAEYAAELAALATDEEKQAFIKSRVKGPLLIYALKDYGAPTGVLIHIQPRSYFNENEELWTGEMPIEHLLTDNFVKYGETPGLFRVNSLDANTTDFILGNKKKLKESLNLRMFLNTADRSVFA